jgi:hypothetical protein
MAARAARRLGPCTAYVAARSPTLHGTERAGGRLPQCSACGRSQRRCAQVRYNASRRLSSLEDVMVRRNRRRAAYSRKGSPLPLQRNRRGRPPWNALAAEGSGCEAAASVRLWPPRASVPRALHRVDPSPQVRRANARQRRGRAGRVAVGVCVHLFTRHTHDCVLDEAQLPEVPIAPRRSRAGSPRRGEPAARRRFAHGR